jgi:hypothetical protein
LYVGLPSSDISWPEVIVSRGSLESPKPHLANKSLPTNKAPVWARCCGVNVKPVLGNSPAVTISTNCSELSGGVELN